MSSVPPPLPSEDPRFTQAHVPPPTPASPPVYPQPPAVPLPVQPIGYGAGSVAGGRPGLITAIGVLSIVIGSLAILFNAGMGMTAFGMMMASRASRAFATAVATPATPAPAQNGLEGDAMTARERRTVINGLAQVRPLSPQRRRQLDALLIEGGRRMINGSGPSLTPESVAGNVSDSGLLPDAGGDRGPDFFIMGRGRLELHDDHAVFFTLDGRDPIRAAAPDDEEDDPLADLEGDSAAGDDPASATQPAGLSARQVKAVVQHIDSLLGAQASTPQRKLTPAQVATLTARFSDPQGGFFSPAPDVAGARGQVTSTFGMPNGNVMVSTRLGHMQVDATGNVTSSFTQSSFATGRGATGLGFQINEMAVLLSLVGALAGMAMAVFLIVAGALVLRQHPRGGRVHAAYAWLKVPLAIACTWAWVAMWSSVSNSVATASGVGGWGPRMTMLAIVLLLLGVAYPIALLLVLRTRTVREYYASGLPARADAWGR